MKYTGVLVVLLTFLTLFFVIDSTANTWSPIDDSSIAARFSTQLANWMFAVIVKIKTVKEEKEEVSALGVSLQLLAPGLNTCFESLRFPHTKLQLPACLPPSLFKICDTSTTRCFKPRAPPFHCVGPSPQCACPRSRGRARKLEQCRRVITTRLCETKVRGGDAATQ